MIKIRVYVNDIFPADVEIDEKTGQTLYGPVHTNHWLNSEWMFWLFEIVATIKAWGFNLYGQEPLFVCRIARKDRQKLKDLGIYDKLKPYEEEE